MRNDRIRAPEPLETSESKHAPGDRMTESTEEFVHSSATEPAGKRYSFLGGTVLDEPLRVPGAGIIGSKEIQILRCMPNPPSAVIRTMAAVCLILDVSTSSGEPKPLNWAAVRKRIMASDIIRAVLDFDNSALLKRPDLASFVAAEYFGVCSPPRGGRGPLSLKLVEKASRTAAVFYRWCALQLSEVLDKGSSEELRGLAGAASTEETAVVQPTPPEDEDPAVEFAPATFSPAEEPSVPVRELPEPEKALPNVWNFSSVLTFPAESLQLTKEHQLKLRCISDAIARRPPLKLTLVARPAGLEAWGISDSRLQHLRSRFAGKGVSVRVSPGKPLQPIASTTATITCFLRADGELRDVLNGKPGSVELKNLASWMKQHFSATAVS